MATVEYQNLKIIIGFYSISKWGTITYFVLIKWDDQPLLNPSITPYTTGEGAFLFMLSLEKDEDYLISFFKQLLKRREDMNLYNQVDPDIKIMAHT